MKNFPLIPGRAEAVVCNFLFVWQYVRYLSLIVSFVAGVFCLVGR